MKRNKAGEVFEAFNQIFDSTGWFCSILTTDAGSEFCANILETFLRTHQTAHHIAKPPLKVQVSFLHWFKK